MRVFKLWHAVMIVAGFNGIFPALAAAEDTTTINLSFVLQADILDSPTRSVHGGYNATLVMSGKTVREQWARTGVAGVNANFFGAQKSLGGGMGAWRVVSPTTISVSRREQNYTKFITVHVSGKSCSVTWQGQLDSGQANYRGLIDGAIHTHTKPTMLDSSCSIK